MALPQSVLFFPYIQVPQATFMVRLLLYWDDVATIVPDPWASSRPAHRRMMLGDFTDTLVEAGLVTMAVPTYDLAFSLDPLVEHFLNLPEPDLQKRSARFKAGKYSLVHRAKFVDHDLLPRLEELGLMTEATDEDLRHAELPEEDRWMWLRVENATTREFMSALARASAEAVPGVEYWKVLEPGGHAEPDEDARRRRIPMAQKPESLLDLANADAHREEARFLDRLEGVRARLLGDVFPAPAARVTAEWIVDTKRRFGHLLTDFRLAVERKIFDAAARQDPELAWGVELASQELTREIALIEKELAGQGIRRFKKIVFAALQLLPFVGPGVEAGREAVDAFADPVGPPRPDPRLAYGAFVHRELKKIAA